MNKLPLAMSPAALLEAPAGQDGPALQSYLGLGVFCVPATDSGLTPEQLSDLSSKADWLWHSPPAAGPRSGGNTLECGILDKSPRFVEACLSRCAALKPLQELVLSKWILLSYRSSAEHGSLLFRVYVLPDDVDRRLIDRDDVKLQKARRKLLARLDFSPQFWAGTWPRGPSEGVSSPRPTVLVPSEDRTGHQSLLHLFNSLPSPNPQPDSLSDPHVSEAAQNLVTSRVRGLRTVLYPYQRRSAAVMLEKESNPGQSMDPRLESVFDQEGEVWYYDKSAGAVLKEPRYYDGVSGGILAEEMGAGKTIICLSLILATKHLYPLAPDVYRGAAPVRPKVGSLVDMAASFITRNSVPWEYHLRSAGDQYDLDFSKCIEAIKRHPGQYLCPKDPPAETTRVTLRGRSRGRQDPNLEPGKLEHTTIYLSKATVIIVPNNLVTQWRQEIDKHTDGLKVLTISRSLDLGKDGFLEIRELLDYDIILFAQTRFEALYTASVGNQSPVSLRSLQQVHFKRCIVDEGHKLGGSKIRQKSNLLLGIEMLRFSSRWIVTGTPAKGLYGIDAQTQRGGAASLASSEPGPNQSEAQDLERIGAMAALYLKVRPWANTITEPGDTPADWAVYVMQPQHSSKSRGRTDSLRLTLSSLIVRHQVAEIGKLLPSVDEKVVILDGSYQDKMSLNIFAMYIVFNSVQSQRTDQDYFFHPRQKKALMQLVYNLRQASFFGGSFFSKDDLQKAIETAELFLEKKDVLISEEDDALLRQAIAFGHVAMANEIRTSSNQFHEIPLHVSAFPGSAGFAWSLNNKHEEPTLTNAPMLFALQKMVRKHVNSPSALNRLLNGGLVEEGIKQRSKALSTEESETTQAGPRQAVLAGNAKLGDNRSPRKGRVLSSLETIQSEMNQVTEISNTADEHGIPVSLAQTMVTATGSAKLSYLIDAIAKYQEDEQIIVFYDNENIAWYIASLLDVVGCLKPAMAHRSIRGSLLFSNKRSIQLQITYLIYAKSLTTEKKAQYVNSFNHSPTFRCVPYPTLKFPFQSEWS